jgi:hypothetical protein
LEGDAVAEGLEVGDCPPTLAIGDARQSSRHQCAATAVVGEQVRVQQDHTGHLQAIGIAMVGLPTVAAPSWSRRG